jgi:hypothetical protein
MKLAILLIAASLPFAALAAPVPAGDDKAIPQKATPAAPAKKKAAPKPAKAQAKAKAPPAKTAPKKEPTRVYPGSYSTTHEPIRDTQGNVIPTDPNAYDVSSAQVPAKK